MCKFCHFSHHRTPSLLGNVSHFKSREKGEPHPCQAQRLNPMPMRWLFSCLGVSASSRCGGFRSGIPFVRRRLLEPVKSVEVSEANWFVVVIVNGNWSFGNPSSGAIAKRPHSTGVYGSAKALQLLRGYWLHRHFSPARLIVHHLCCLHVLEPRQGFTLSQTSGCQRNLAAPLRCKGA